MTGVLFDLPQVRDKTLCSLTYAWTSGRGMSTKIRSATAKMPPGWHDVSQVVERAEQIWQEDKGKSVLLSRVKFCGGSFFAHGGYKQPACNCKPCILHTQLQAGLAHGMELPLQPAGSMCANNQCGYLMRTLLSRDHPAGQGW